MNKLCEMCNRKCKVIVTGSVIEMCDFLKESDEARKINKQIKRDIYNNKKKKRSWLKWT